MSHSNLIALDGVVVSDVNFWVKSTKKYTSGKLCFPMLSPSTYTSAAMSVAKPLPCDTKLVKYFLPVHVEPM